MPPSDPFGGVLEGLGKSARAAYPYLRSLANTDLSANAILQQLRDQGVPLQRQAGLDIIAVLRNKADLGQFTRTFGENTILPGVIHQVAPLTFSEGSKYQYLVGTNSDNPLIPEAIYVNSKTPLSANQIYGQAAAAFTYEEGSGMAAGDLSDVIFTLDDARYSPGSTP